MALCRFISVYISGKPRVGAQVEVKKAASIGEKVPLLVRAPMAFYASSFLPVRRRLF